LSRDSITTHKLAQSITHNFWFIDPNEWFKAFHVDINLKNQFQISNFLKSDFQRSFFAARAVRQAIKTTYHTITFEPCSQKLWKLLRLKATPHAHVVWKFHRKKQTPFVVSCLKSLCCQITQFRSLGVKSFYFDEWVWNYQEL